MPTQGLNNSWKESAVLLALPFDQACQSLEERFSLPSLPVKFSLYIVQPLQNFFTLRRREPWWLRLCPYNRSCRYLVPMSWVPYSPWISIGSLGVIVSRYHIRIGFGVIVVGVYWLLKRVVRHGTRVCRNWVIKTHRRWLWCNWA